jgi:hypothetical protein
MIAGDEAYFRSHHEGRWWASNVGMVMSWDDNWTRTLVAIPAATAGAINAGIVNAQAANRKIRDRKWAHCGRRPVV